MNENIGVKGDSKDRRKTNLIISQKKKRLELYNKALKEEKLKRLEKQVRKQQMINFFMIIPLLATAKTLDTIYKNVCKKEKEDKIESLEEKPLDKIAIKPITEEKYIVPKKSVPKINIKIIKEKTITKEEIEKELKIPKKVYENKEESKEYSQKKDKCIESSQEKSKKKKEYENITNKKILTEYETNLKEIRNDLKNITYEFKLLSIEQKQKKNKEDIEFLLDKINIVIRKINNLEKKIDFDNESIYDNNYINELVSEYIESFKARKNLAEIKDSELYILIAEKITRLEEEKKKFKETVDSKKNDLDITEEDIKKRQKEFYDFDNINNELLKIQYEQDYNLKQLEEKIRTAESIEEKIKYQIKFMKNESDRILEKMAKPRLIPGVRSGKIMAFLGATFLFFTKKMKYPKIERKSYKVITIKDYTDELETNMEKIVGAEELLKKTTIRINDMIKNFEMEYQDYIDKIPEAEQLVNNLYAMKENLKEKEYEIEKITSKQKQLIKKNQEKVRIKE